MQKNTCAMAHVKLGVQVVQTEPRGHRVIQPLFLNPGLENLHGIGLSFDIVDALAAADITTVGFSTLSRNAVQAKRDAIPTQQGLQVEIEFGIEQAQSRRPALETTADVRDQICPVQETECNALIGGWCRCGLSGFLGTYCASRAQKKHPRPKP